MGRLVSTLLRRGGVIPAHPLALTASGRFDERRQRALTRYYLDAGAAGIAVGVHTTQFAIRRHGLYRPVLALAAETARDWAPERRVLTVAGVVGPTRQAVREAEVAASLGYDVVLVSLGGLGRRTDEQLVEHLRAVGEILPVMGFYLQPAVGGRLLSYRFWRRVAEVPALAAIKIAPFNRYQTIDVIRAVVDAGRHGDIALYTGNDDNIVTDLLTTFRLPGPDGRSVAVRFAGGLLGHWACWTRRAVELARWCRSPDPAQRRRAARLAAAVTDANGALFDVAHGFAGSIAGIHEILRRQGLLASRRCLDPRETLSPGQGREIARVCRAYPTLADDAFVAARLSRWLG